MPKNRVKPAAATKPHTPQPVRSGRRVWPICLGVVVLGGGITLALFNREPRTRLGLALSTNATGGLSPGSTQAAATAHSPSPAAAADTNAAALPNLEAAQSVVVTQDLDFGPRPPGLAAVMLEIDRRHQPDDGVGRTFAILEAFNGEVQPDGKVRVSLRVSTEEPGVGEIVFRRTGQVLWKTRITPATRAAPFNAGALMILFDNGEGKTFMVDGSTGAASILEAPLKETSFIVAQAWPDGASHELSFIYSACGCPIKVLCRREGNRTVRANAGQVIFPDDPAVVQVINALMGWK